MTYFCREVEQSSRETYEQDKESNAQGRGECPPEGKFETVQQDASQDRHRWRNHVSSSIDISITSIDASTKSIDANTMSIDASTMPIDASTMSIDASTMSIDASTTSIDNCQNIEHSLIGKLASIH